MIRAVDCVRLRVQDLESGLAFYRDGLGHEPIWRTDRAVGLRMPDCDAEIVLQTEDEWQETDLDELIALASDSLNGDRGTFNRAALLKLAHDHKRRLPKVSRSTQDRWARLVREG